MPKVDRDRLLSTNAIEIAKYCKEHWDDPAQECGACLLNREYEGIVVGDCCAFFRDALLAQSESSPAESHPGVPDIAELQMRPIAPQIGWICPVCRAGLAPWVSRCRCQAR